MRRKIAALVITVTCGVATADAINDLAFVVPDRILAQNRRTREQANKDCPPCEKRWREAWAAEGTKRDNRAFAGIRRDTTKPADMPPSTPPHKEK